LIRLYTDTPQSQIFYTLNGSVPTNTPSSTNFLYDANNPLSISENVVLRIRAFKDNLEPSEVRILNLVVNATQSTPPSLSPAAGTYQNSVTVSISGAPGAIIRYTLNGNDPDTSSCTYSAPFNLNSTTTIKARAWETGKTPSPIIEGTYTISSGSVQADPPTFSHQGGNYTNNLPNLWDSMYAVNPEQTINYISAHDNFGLWDKVYLSLSSNVSQNSSHQVLSLTPPSNLNYPKRVAWFGMGMVLTSQGIPFIHAGDEFLRTKTYNEEMNNSNAWNYGQHGGTHNTYMPLIALMPSVGLEKLAKLQPTTSIRTWLPCVGRALG